MVKVYYVRHGQTVANIERFVAGRQTDTPLTEIGKLQALETGSLLKSKHIIFDAVISSSLSRAIDTAKIIKTEIGDINSLIISPNWDEKDVGDATKMSIEDYFKLEDDKVSIPNAETPEEFKTRIIKGLEDIKGLNVSTVLVVSHGGLSRMLRCILNNLSATESFEQTELNNGEVWEFEI